MKTKPTYLIFLIVILMISLTASEVISQNSNRLDKFVNEVNEIFLSPYADGILLSPYEILQHNRNRTIRHVEMVETIEHITKNDTIMMFVQDNRTIIHEPDEGNNARIYSYHKDGRINKVLQGRYVKDHFLYDEYGYLIQHGHGGELKKATRKDKTFEWYKVSKNELVYVASFDDNDRLESFKTMKQYNLECEVENYTWEENQLVSKNSILQYKDAVSDTSFMKIQYDSLGLVNVLLTSYDNEYWSTVTLTSQIEELDAEQLKIIISKDEHVLLAVTYDKFDNWVEIYRPDRIINRVISYRKKRRRK